MEIIAANGFGVPLFVEELYQDDPRIRRAGKKTASDKATAPLTPSASLQRCTTASDGPAGPGWTAAF
jgi:hypothetical protein